MEIITRRENMTAVARKLRAEKRTIGFVPTMGALHEGHLSLVDQARAASDVVVASIFVNPTQFGPSEDFKAYPRDLIGDSALLADHHADCVFAPAVEEIYPSGFSTQVTVQGLTNKLEGAARQGHFRGVTTVVAILLNIVRPDFAFFGQKDAQQAIVVKRMVRDLAFPTKVVVAPIVREASGLAMSSRNNYLNDEERRTASVLNCGLMKAEAAYEEGERNGARLVEIVRSTIDEEPSVRIDYIEINDAETLADVDWIEDRPALLSLAAFIGKTRLIDNIVLGQTEKQDAAGANA